MRTHRHTRRQTPLPGDVYYLCSQSNETLPPLLFPRPTLFSVDYEGGLLRGKQHDISLIFWFLFLRIFHVTAHVFLFRLKVYTLGWALSTFFSGPWRFVEPTENTLRFTAPQNANDLHGVALFPPFFCGKLNPRCHLRVSPFSPAPSCPSARPPATPPPPPLPLSALPH